MLHATLHGKLSGHIPEPERLEDALTSTVFGTLLLSGEGGVCSQWVSESRDTTGRRLNVGEAGKDEFTAWFWPRLPYAEPDVVIRFGDTVLVVEAKLQSGRHDLSLEAEEQSENLSGDQLLRQIQSVEHICAGGTCRLEALDQAIRSCEIRFIYVVDERRISRARREVCESSSCISNPERLFLLTWQKLHSILVLRPGCRWAEDLAKYLTMIGLDSFTGLSTPASALRSRDCLYDWRKAIQSGDSFDLLPREIPARLLARLRSWRNRSASKSAGTTFQQLSRHQPTAARVISRWMIDGFKGIRT